MKNDENSDGKRLSLGIDIERSGARGEHDTFCIGAAVRDENAHELDRWVGKAYVPGDCAFEERCKTEFWDNNPEALKACEYKGPSRSKPEREEAMIRGLLSFIEKWERKADEAGLKLDVVSDNAEFDFGFVDDLIFRHVPDAMPLCYRVTDGKYRRTWDTHCVQRGFLLAVDSEFALNNTWGYTKRIEKLYDVPSDSVVHDHEADNDASTIAKENAVLLGIARGTIKRKGEPVKVESAKRKKEEA